MNHLPMRLTLFGLAALTLGGSMDAGAQNVVGSFERSFALEGPVRLEVRTGSGAVTVRGGSGDRVEIVGRIHVWPRRESASAETEELIRELEADPPIEVSGNLVTVGRHGDRDYDGFLRHVSISYEIDVPRATEVTSGSGSGSQEISGVSGPVRASSGSGSVTLIDVGGPVDARAGSGSIRAERVAGAFNASAGSGSIALMQSSAGNVNISTGSGSSDIRGVSGELRARAGSGRIAVEGEQTGLWDLETGSGSIRIDLPADASFDLDARTNSGGIHTDHPVTIRGTTGRDELSGQVRGGGPLLRVRAGSGSIRIE